MRFQRRKKIFPGVKLNFSKSGISTTIGIPGLSVNIGQNGTFLNTGLPGTGISHRHKLGSKADNSSKPSEPEVFENVHFYSPDEIKSDIPSEITSPSLVQLRLLLNDCLREENEINVELKKTKLRLTLLTISQFILYILIVGFLWKTLKNRIIGLKTYKNDLLDHLASCHVALDHDLSEIQLSNYEKLVDEFEQLSKAKCIWDVTNSVKVNQVKERSSASNSITRNKVQFYKRDIRLIKSKFPALAFKNSNGADLFFYPGFILVYESDKSFGLVDFNDLHVSHIDQRFIEEEAVPSDSQIVDYTWAKVNKNGSPDKRFKDNYQIPIALYGKLEIQSPSGLNEQWSVSNPSLSDSFTKAWLAFTRENR